MGRYLVVGHSFGGYCSTLFAARYPKQVVGAVLVDANHVAYFTDAHGPSRPNMPYCKRSSEKQNPASTGCWQAGGNTIRKCGRLLFPPPYPSWTSWRNVPRSNHHKKYQIGNGRINSLSLPPQTADWSKLPAVAITLCRTNHNSSLRRFAILSALLAQKELAYFLGKQTQQTCDLGQWKC